MAWTYSGNPGLNAKDQVRFLIQDTDKSQQLLEDEEILWLLTLYNNAPRNAAIRACEVLISKFARMVDQTVGQVKVSWSQRMKSYEFLLNTLRSRLAMEDSSWYAGGISRSDKMTKAADSDRVQPDFTKHMMENHQLAPWGMQNQLGVWCWWD